MPGRRDWAASLPCVVTRFNRCAGRVLTMPSERVLVIIFRLSGAPHAEASFRDRIQSRHARRHDSACHHAQLVATPIVERVIFTITHRAATSIIRHGRFHCRGGGID